MSPNHKIILILILVAVILAATLVWALVELNEATTLFVQTNEKLIELTQSTHVLQEGEYIT